MSWRESWGAETNIRLHILAYIPERLLVLKTDKAPPGFASEELLNKLVSVFEFVPTDDGRTRVIVTGVGYGSDEESEQLKDFFIKGNSWSLQALHERFETGPTDCLLSLNRARLSELDYSWRLGRHDRISRLTDPVCSRALELAE